MHYSTGRDSSSPHARDVVEQLTSWLHDDDQQIRFETARVLASLGDRGVPVLIAASRADNSDIRSIAAWGLGLTDKEEAVDPLLSALADPDSGVRFWAANALGRLGTLSSLRALDPLILTLRDESPDVRATLIEALGAIGDTRALPCIIAALEDAHGMVHRVAIESLGRFKNSPAAVDALLPMLGDESDTFCKAAAVSLSEVGELAFSALLTVLAGGGSRARQWAAIALGHTKGRQAVEPLARAAADADAHVRAGAVQALGMIGDEAACEPVLAALTDEDRWVRLQAIRALGQVDGQRALDTLLQLLASDDEDVHLQAAMSLGRRGDERAIQPLLAKLRQGVRSDLYLALLKACRGKSDAVEPLLQALHDESSAVRGCTVDALAWPGNTPAFDAVAAMLHDPDSDVRWRTAHALSRIDSAAAIPHLVAALSDTDDNVRAVAATELGEIGDASALPALDQIRLTDTGAVSDDMASYPIADMAGRAVKLVQLRELLRNHASADSAGERDSNP